MSPASASRRRMIAAATFVACLLVAGPAAYAAGAATSDGDDRSTSNVAESGEGVTGAGSGSGGHDHSSSADPTQDGGDTGGQDAGSQDGGSQDAAGQDAAGQDAAGQDDGQDAGAQGGAGDADGAGGDDAAGRADGPDGAAAALDILASDCTGSRLQPHDGFQKAPRCVSTEFGEVAAADQSPSLLITDSPDEVAQGEGFSMTVSTRNLVRDRFLAAAQGGYYVESSLLNGQGLQRGHFHTACRMLPNPAEAPDSAPDPLFFEATEDGAGGSTPDEVKIDVPGIQQSGELQCSSWAGDGSHRTPMMQRANQTPAFDSVRIKVG
ncbi:MULTISPECIES: Pecanex-like protein 1 [unclassified Pseudonocardia]|uniref:Pecanex-like protein 1 n=1 Tax=unclassified Pseudonocardia TaxID=2619320 RepID=UPI000960FE58|nr:Pecanex-like protein 1 [Pseudonocardia sp. Ae707_Ps1]OLM15967.1 Chitinase [Pseudonocardia sp. Ae707_Ps1]